MMLIVESSISSPPDPLLPRSRETMCRAAAPLKFASGENVRPSSAALTAFSVPEIATSTSPVPVPVAKTSPIVEPSVMRPLVAVSRTSIRPLP